MDNTWFYIQHFTFSRRSEKVNISGNGMDPGLHHNKAFDEEAAGAEPGNSAQNGIANSITTPANGWIEFKWVNCNGKANNAACVIVWYMNGKCVHLWDWIDVIWKV